MSRALRTQGWEQPPIHLAQISRHDEVRAVKLSKIPHQSLVETDVERAIEMIGRAFPSFDIPAKLVCSNDKLFLFGALVFVDDNLPRMSRLSEAAELYGFVLCDGQIAHAPREGRWRTFEPTRERIPWTAPRAADAEAPRKAEQSSPAEQPDSHSSDDSSTSSASSEERTEERKRDPEALANELLEEFVDLAENAVDRLARELDVKGAVKGNVPRSVRKFMSSLFND
jgi:hypothetical protein